MERVTTDLIGTLLYQIVVITEDNISKKRIMKEDTINNIVSDTGHYTLEQQAEFYQMLIPILKTSESEEEIIGRVQNAKRQLQATAM